ncbi:MAG: hypothetical protein H5T61_12790 [Thermoflexales bacterium]|nr:hypothetical protein [Thermoflexales bacterium]
MLLSLSACIPVTPATPMVDIGDGGFLSEEPCGPPCFWGIIPGQTTEAEVIKILQRRGMYATCEVRDFEPEGGERVISCGSRLIIGFERGSEVVNGIGFSPSLTIAAEEVITKYGEPELVEVGGLGVHVIDFQLTMAYPGMLTWVRLSLQDKLPYILEPSTRVRNIAYAVDFGDPCYYEDNPLWKEWHGYGEYP